MAKKERPYEDRVFSCLIDRLIMGFPILSGSARDKAFLMDLEWLLSSRSDRFWRKRENQLDDYPDVARSVLNFGVPDPSLRKGANDEEKLRWLENRVSQAICDFEPRLVPEKLEVEAEQLNGSIGFRIKGELRNLEPVPGPFFATVDIDLESGKCSFRDRGGI